MKVAVPVGAAFGVPLSDGRFGLVRVIGHNGEAPKGSKTVLPRGLVPFQVLATRWVGTQRELATATRDPRARQALQPTFTTKDRNKPYVVWETAPPPASFVPLEPMPPSDEERTFRSVFYSWNTLPHRIEAQLEYEADPTAFANKFRDGRVHNPAPQAESRAEVRPSRVQPAGKAPTLAALARRKPFADWQPVLQTHARAHVAALIATLREQPRDQARDLRAFVRCARAFNRERSIGTLEAEALDDVLLQIAWAVGIPADTYGRAIDAVRDW